MSIAAKLVAAMGEIDSVTKEGKNQAQGYNYVRAADVAMEVRKHLVKHGIAFGFDVIEEERWQTDRYDRQGTIIGHMNYVRVVVECEFTDSESGESVRRKGRGWGQDVGEKAIYKAMTGALKYALRMNFIIPDELDPENEKAEVEAEVERQKKNPSKVEELTPATRLRAELTGSLTPEERAAAERTKLADQQGIFSLDGDVLTCKIIGIQKKQMGPKTKTPGKEFRSVTFNGRLPNGANYASCFDTELWDSIDACLDKECQIKVEVRGAYANVVDVLATSLKHEPLFEGA